MTPEDRAGFEKLKAFVDSFPPARWETRAGVPVRDKNGNEQFSKRFINTKELLDCKNAAEAKICLLAADDQATKKAKKSKGRAGVVLDQSKPTPGNSLSPGGRASSSQAGV
ncbi:hypothetical protein A2U01_0014884 [Trifolium medium]|uniref:Uncharacterized protein n=1 Tax=Trifolium medium TaxID=97028 RepID=A0A392N288_9FABA|nr:hypothetical protein [Trifolium medium]